MQDRYGIDSARYGNAPVLGNPYSSLSVLVGMRDAHLDDGLLKGRFSHQDEVTTRPVPSWGRGQLRIGLCGFSFEFEAEECKVEGGDEDCHNGECNRGCWWSPGARLHHVSTVSINQYGVVYIYIGITTDRTKK